MSIDIENQNQKSPGNGKMLVGLLLLVLGIGFLFQQLDFFFIPNWLFSWPSWLIIWGLYAGARHNQKWNGQNWEKRNNNQFHSFDNNI